jgi:ribonuclease P protein subunit RPR2
MKRQNKEQTEKIAEERVNILFGLAEKAASEGDFDSADRYVAMFWKIKLKTQLKLTDYQKRLFCRKCLKFLANGKTGRYRTEDKKLIITCLNCGNVRRYPFSQ